MNMLVKLAEFLVPYLINFVSKHIDDWLESLNKSVALKILDKSDVVVKLTILDTNLIPIKNPVAYFDTTKYGTVGRQGDESGIINIQGITHGSRKITIEASDYSPVTLNISIPNSESVIDKSIILRR